ncbi:hypothetical protein LDG_5705 [Legionella drancourtii LLAP12]|uniref:Uncharacterized protein n=1 Tax=Legionella drancourtii LLAP12 TaxID=658187 RepID=G9EKH1_9GAMM|nr:hypothetical protein LDG_5705 [Legionella drancourtii LLAP12]
MVNRTNWEYIVDNLCVYHFFFDDAYFEIKSCRLGGFI